MSSDLDLTPTAEELAEQQTQPEMSWDEALRARYAELLRDKRSALEGPCHTWDQHGCHCDHEPTPEVVARPCDNHSRQWDVTRTNVVHVGDVHSGPAHAAKEGRPWCPAHQQACDERHPFLTEEQFVRRFRPTEASA